MIVLPDVNLLLALAWNNHRHHELAHDWLNNKQETEWATCLLTQSAFMRLSLNPQAVKFSIPASSAFEALNRIIAHPEHRFLANSPQLTEAPFAELVSRIAGYRQVPDATLLSMARMHDAKLVTFDRGAGGLCPWKEHVQVLEAS